MKYSYQDALAIGGITDAHPGGFALTKKILNEEKIKPGSLVLDAGCGMGMTSAFLAKEKKCRVYAIDLHPKMLEHASNRFQTEKLPGKVLKANIENLPFPDDTFDYIVAESVTIFTNIKKALKEAFRVLKPGGIIINIELTLEEPLPEEELAPLKSFYKMNKVPTEHEWMQLYDQAGFKQVNILKANTILQELEDYWTRTDEQTNLDTEVNLDPAVEEVLADHSRLMVDYAETLGYRVFKAAKG